MSHPDDSVDVDFWYTSNDDRSLVFVKSMKEYLTALYGSKGGINFKPNFVSWSCPHCDSEFKKRHCLSDGKYCAMNHDMTESKYVQNGNDVILENLRMRCVFDNARKFERFFDYISRVHELCEDRITQNCHEKAMASFKELRLKNNVDKCIYESFEMSGPEPDYSKDDNKILREM